MPHTTLHFTQESAPYHLSHYTKQAGDTEHKTQFEQNTLCIFCSTLHTEWKARKKLNCTGKAQALSSSVAGGITFDTLVGKSSCRVETWWSLTAHYWGWTLCTVHTTEAGKTAHYRGWIHCTLQRLNTLHTSDTSSVGYRTSRSPWLLHTSWVEIQNWTCLGFNRLRSEGIMDSNLDTVQYFNCTVL